MSKRNVNVVMISGNLTRDPELRTLASGTPVCNLGIAVNDRFKDSMGEWTERANFFTITVWGAQGENCARFLTKGRAVNVVGKLRFESWDDDQGNKRSTVKIVAEMVEFLGDGGNRSSSDGYGAGRDYDPTPTGTGEPSADESGFTPRSDVPTDGEDGFAPISTGTGAPPDDDIPF